MAATIFSCLYSTGCCILFAHDPPVYSKPLPNGHSLNIDEGTGLHAITRFGGNLVVPSRFHDSMGRNLTIATVGVSGGDVVGEVVVPGTPTAAGHFLLDTTNGVLREGLTLQELKDAWALRSAGPLPALQSPQSFEAK